MKRIRLCCFTITVLIAVLGLHIKAAATEFNANTKGSVFFIPNVEIRWDAQGNLVQDTFVHLHNDFPASVNVLMYFVNGDEPLAANGNERAHPGCNRLDSTIFLTQNQPAYWSMSTGLGAPSPAIPPFTLLDPGNPPGRPDPEGSTDRVLRGYVVGWAVNFSGEEIRWNHLSTTATVIDYRTGGAWGYNGYHAQAVDPAINNGQQTGTPGTLNFNGVEFSQPYDVLLFNFPADGSALYGNTTTTVTVASDLTLQPVSNDLRQATTSPILTNAKIEVWNENEMQFSGMNRCVNCWDQLLLSQQPLPNNFLETVLQTDVGWAEVDGNANASCFDPNGTTSVNASLIGVLSRQLVFGAGAATDYAGFNLLGRGGEDATIFYDVPVSPDPRDLAQSESQREPANSVVEHFVHLAALTNEFAEPQNQKNVPRTRDALQSNRGFTSEARISSSRPGNLVFISKVDVRWDAQGNLTQDTFVHLTNWFTEPVKVQMYFVNGDDPIPQAGPERAHPGWNNLNLQIDLTPRQPAYWSAVNGNAAMGIPSWSDLDPGPPPGRPDPVFGGRMMRGYIVAWAIDNQCREIAGNVLMADAILVNYQFTSSWGYTGYHLPNIANVPFGDPSPTPGVLELDGLQDYPMAFDQLSFISPASGSFAYNVGNYVVQSSADVTLHQLTADFTPNSPGPLKSRASYDVWNQNEFRFSGMFKCITCWDQTFLANYPIPTNFNFPNLQTNIGAARINGIANALCDTPAPLSVNASMLGLLSNVLSIDGLNGVGDIASVGHNMFGQGTENAQIDSELCDACPWDIATSAGPGMDGQVNVFDLLLLLANWNTNGPGAAIAPSNNIVDVFDLLELLANWGPCP